MNSAERRLHERTLELASSAIDFNLTSAEAVELEAHLDACPLCSRDAAALQADAAAIRAPARLMPSRRVDDAVYREITRGGARSQRYLVLAAAALLLLALLAAVAVGAALLRVETLLPVTVVPPAPVTVVSPGPDTLPVVVGEVWETVAIPPSDAGTGWIGLMEAVAVTESGFVAVGRPVCVPQNDPTTCHASVWTAVPGDDWTRAPDQLALELSPTFPTSGPGPGMFDVAAGPAGLVAIGFDLDPQAGGPAVWHSSGGRTWQRVQVAFGSSPTEAYYTRVTAVVAGPQGYVVVGHVVDTGPGRVASARAAAWASSDGVTWTRAADTDAMDVGPCLDTGEDPSCGGMLAVTPADSGYVAVGQARSEAGNRIRPAAWTSPDGLSWTRADAGLDFEGHLSGVTAGGTGLVAVGTICLPDCTDLPAVGGVAATSSEGSTWTFTPVVGATALGNVAFAGGHAFALGERVVLEPPTDLELWRTDDGIAWQRVSSMPAIAGASDFGGLDIGATPDRLAIVGWADVSGEVARQNFAYVSPPVATTAPPLETPRPTPTASPTSTAPTGPVASSIDPVVVLRVEIRPDVSVGRFPSLTVYRDGTVLRRDDASGRITRLTPGGLALLLAPATDSDLLVTSGEIRPDPAYQGGFSTYTIDLRRGDQLVHRSTTNSLTSATRAEGERIIALAEHMEAIESWLPANAWATGPATSEPYVASQFLLKVTVFKQVGVDYPPQALDRTDVVWPLAGELEGFGDLLAEPPLGAGTTSRCGPVTLAEATAVQRALVAAPLVPMGERVQADLDWAPSIGHVTISLVALLPEDPLDCSVDGSWP